MGPRIALPKTPLQIAAWPLKYGGVGSRDTPQDIQRIMSDLGCALCNVGYLGMSGEADGADFAFHEGARSSPRYSEVGFAAFLPFNPMTVKRQPAPVFEDWAHGIYDASQFPNFDQANELAFRARGSFHGLYEKGIALHTRNAYQVLSPTLQNPVRRLICWAEPTGSNSGRVRGGTNTAVQIALSHNVPVVNLYYDEKVAEVLDFINRVREKVNDTSAA